MFRGLIKKCSLTRQISLQWPTFKYNKQTKYKYIFAMKILCVENFDNLPTSVQEN